jgi:Ca2+-binding EF-hand superfamily protein
LTFDQIQEYEAAFRAVDVDDDGVIDVKELCKRPHYNLKKYDPYQLTLLVQ